MIKLAKFRNHWCKRSYFTNELLIMSKMLKSKDMTRILHAMKDQNNFKKKASKSIVMIGFDASNLNDFTVLH